MKIIKDYIEKDYRIIEYENGAIVKEPLSNGTIEEKPIVIPPSPLEVLRKENEELRVKVTNLELAMSNIMGV